MSKLTKLEAGKTYVFKDEYNKQEWLDHSVGNYRVLHQYNEGFTIDTVTLGSGFIGTTNVIIKDELKYFKLKEEKIMQQPKHIRPEDEVTITTTYGELARAYAILGKVGGMSYGTGLWSIIGELIDGAGSVYDRMVWRKDLEEAGSYSKYQKEWLAALFPKPTPVESPTQRKARELREQAEELLAKAKELEEVM